ncbi:hypothetical protein DICVIV_09232 [Dictyocaulus viviparus]|uniref:Uncharacterized protein n=1 Tax=Dictyocaulus viviparus TaxID=29172 RepID=A0A0D8XQY6_DICVI|nr:hypothetical protein DICVIV_09232 [Dictyocaulus viviparus]
MHTLLFLTISLMTVQAYLYDSGCGPCAQQWHVTSSSYQNLPYQYSQTPSPSYSSYQQVQVPSRNYYYAQQPTYNSYQARSPPFNPYKKQESFESPTYNSYRTHFYPYNAYKQVPHEEIAYNFYPSQLFPHNTLENQVLYGPSSYPGEYTLPQNPYIHSVHILQDFFNKSKSHYPIAKYNTAYPLFDESEIVSSSMQPNLELPAQPVAPVFSIPTHSNDTALRVNRGTTSTIVLLPDRSY